MRRIVPHVLGQPAQVLRIEHGPSESLGSDEIRVRASCAPIHRDSLLGVSFCPRTPDMATTVSERFGHARREFLERAGRRQHAERREQLSHFLDHSTTEPRLLDRGRPTKRERTRRCVEKSDSRMTAATN